MFPIARLLILLLLLLRWGNGSALAAESGARRLHAELNPPRVPGVQVRDLRSTAATLEWPAALSSGDRFQVQIRRFTPDPEQGLAMQWESFSRAEIKREGALWHARIRGLLPGQPYWFRVLPQAPAGAAVEALFAVRFQTPPKVPIFTGQRLLMGGLGAALVLLLWIRWQRARGPR